MFPFNTTVQIVICCCKQIKFIVQVLINYYYIITWELCPLFSKMCRCAISMQDGYMNIVPFYSILAKRVMILDLISLIFRNQIKAGLVYSLSTKWLNTSTIIQSTSNLGSYKASNNRTSDTNSLPYTVLTL